MQNLDGTVAVRASRVGMRVLLFVWVALVGCTIRYWPAIGSIDNTWVFAHNYAAANGLQTGRDIMMTTGPLGWLVYPQDIGNNLNRALVFQCVVWLVLAVIWADLFFRTNWPLGNLAFFAFFFALSGPLYWFNYLGMDYVLLAAAMALLVIFRLRGGLERYILALAIFGVVPLIKATAAIVAVGALIGFLVDRVWRKRKEAWREVVLGVSVPASVFALGSWLLLASLPAFVQYIRMSVVITSSFSVAMSKAGDLIELAAAGQTLVWIGVFVFWGARRDRDVSYFCTLLLAIPLFLSFKHGFVRQDTHVVNFFCFASLAFALVALAIPLSRDRTPKAALILLAYSIIWLEYMNVQIGMPAALEQASGWRSAQYAAGVLSWPKVRAQLEIQSIQQPWKDVRLEPAIGAIVRSSPVASLSLIYSSARLDGLNLKIFPSVQRYLACTPELDRLNADWIRDQGPRFLMFDGSIVEWRHPWAETPAMWLEIYRWYNTRALTDRTLLLERRSFPRFDQLEKVAHFEQPFTGELKMPASQPGVFWTMQCGMSIWGELRKTLFPCRRS